MQKICFIWVYWVVVESNGGFGIECYTDREIASILASAVYDYIDTCDKPSAFLRDIIECIPKGLTLAERICSAFTLVQVKGNNEYVNGFKEEFFRWSERKL